MDAGLSRRIDLEDGSFAGVVNVILNLVTISSSSTVPSIWARMEWWRCMQRNTTWSARYPPN